MKKSTLVGLLALAACTAPAMADTFTISFPAGIACEFELRIDGSGSGVRVDRQPVNGRWSAISAGTGSDLVLTNTSNQATLTLQGNGAVVKTQRAAENGSTVTTMTGHNILFMFPTDTPAGPSSTLYVGQVTFATDALSNTTLLSHSGKTMDLCQALAQ